ncbi:MAG: tetratricopeptide repeat protein [Planctomycetes bacterium]|nr:tetratricopeptide repeat protein [Planctomycetota bacterium]
MFGEFCKRNKTCKGKKGCMIMVLRCMVCSWLFLGWIDPFADQVRQGNELYNNGKYDEALDKYLNAQITSPDVPQVFFNVADTQYKRGKYDEALKSFEKSMKTGNPELQAKSSFNIGNTLYKQGKLSEALEWYKKTVDIVDELSPQNGSKLEQLKNDAKYNYEFVERKLEEKEQQQGQDNQQQQQEQEKEQEQEQQDNQDKGDDQSDETKEEENKEQEPDKENQQSENQQEKDLDKEKEQPPHPNEAQQQNQPSSQQQEHTQSQQERPHQMSKEEAERILDALNQSEKEMRNINREKSHQPHRSVEKDW